MDPALEATLNAAVKALEAGRVEDALASLEVVLERLEDEVTPDPEAEMLAAGLMAPAVGALGRIEEARRWAARAEKLARDLGNDEAAAHYAGLRTQAVRVEARQRVDERISGEQVERGLDEATAALTRGDAAAAEAALTPLLDVAIAYGLDNVEASARGMLAQALVMQARPEEALAHVERAVELAEEAGDPRAVAHFRELAVSLAAEGAQSAGATVGRSLSTARLAKACEESAKALEEDQPDQAIALLAPLIEEAERCGVPAAEASCRGLLAQALYMGGDRVAAEEHAAKALAIAHVMGESEAIDSFTQLLAMISGWTTPVGTD